MNSNLQLAYNSANTNKMDENQKSNNQLNKLLQFSNHITKLKMQTRMKIFVPKRIKN